MLKGSFIFSWLSSAGLMFGLSYLWHGVILNDLVGLPVPLAYYLTLLSIVYLVVAFVLTFIFNYTSIGEGFTYKGMCIGGALGFFIYLIAFTLGVSFSTNMVEHIVVDFLWQMIEQGVGGGWVGLIFLFAKRRAQMLEEE